MLLFMKIRCLDRNTREVKYRGLHLNTKSLDPALRAVVELLAEDKSPRARWEMLKYKDLFSEREPEEYLEIREVDKFATVGPLEYLEDENGKQLAQNEIAFIMTGDPNAIMIPSGTKQYEIDYMLAEKKPLPLSDVTLTDDELRLLGYFVRDLAELKSVALIKEGPGSLQIMGPPFEHSVHTQCYIETAVSDDEIRSCVAIFRRLYMQDEPSNLAKSVAIFVRVIGEHRCTDWIKGAHHEYQSHILSVPKDRAHMLPDTCTFSTKLLLDIFFYTHYFHQPSTKRQQEYLDCLSQVNGSRDLLTWLFLTEMWDLSLQILAIGQLISSWYDAYCKLHNKWPSLIDSLSTYHQGIGIVEKAEDQKDRILQEKAKQLAHSLWLDAGKPEGGPNLYVETARKQLVKMLQA